MNIFAEAAIYSLSKMYGNTVMPVKVKTRSDQRLVLKPCILGELRCSVLALSMYQLHSNL